MLTEDIMREKLLCIKFFTMLFVVTSLTVTLIPSQSQLIFFIISIVQHFVA